MNIRTIITNALKRLNVSQPSPAHLDKGKLSVERFWKEFSANGLINSNITIVTPELENVEGNIYTTELEDVSAIIGLIDGNHTCKQVDVGTWYNHQNNVDYYCLSQEEDSKFLIGHRVNQAVKLIVRKQVSFDLDDDLTLPEELLPLIELYVMKDLARTQEQYTRYQAEYDAMLLRVKDNRATFVLPTRDVDEYGISRRWMTEG